MLDVNSENYRKKVKLKTEPRPLSFDGQSIIDVENNFQFHLHVMNFECMAVFCMHHVAITRINTHTINAFHTRFDFLTNLQCVFDDVNDAITLIIMMYTYNTE